MTDQHPITPPPELVEQWECEYHRSSSGPDFAFFISERAAQWGADQELEACCQWLDKSTVGMTELLHTARRPKPPTLKEQALALVSHNFSDQPCLSEEGYAIIRRALEALPND